MKKISLIGSTGSIGAQVCNVVRRHPQQFQIESIVANASTEAFLRQVQEFKPRYAALADEESGKAVAHLIPDGVSFAYGEQAALDGVSYGDTVVVATTGFAGLKYSLKAIEENKALALANKETLVCGGALVMRKMKGAGMRLMPIDSEHSALWQALNYRLDAPFKRLILTASGGPFYGYTQEELKEVTVEKALRHPTWSMGAKITVDSATLLNKGFEVIEAHWLYDCPYEKIATVVQPESIIHSMVEFDDGCVMAQMSYPTMEIPIQLALTYPNRLQTNVSSLDFEKLSALRFLPLERKAFPCFDLALQAGENGGDYACALNGAGEVAVRAFLDRKIPFTAIADTMQDVLKNTPYSSSDTYEGLLEIDEKSRALARAYIQKTYK